MVLKKSRIMFGLKGTIGMISSREKFPLPSFLPMRIILMQNILIAIGKIIMKSK